MFTQSLVKIKTERQKLLLQLTEMVSETPLSFNTSSTEWYLSREYHTTPGIPVADEAMRTAQSWTVTCSGAQSTCKWLDACNQIAWHCVIQSLDTCGATACSSFLWLADHHSALAVVLALNDASTVYSCPLIRAFCVVLQLTQPKAQIYCQR